MTHEIAVVCAPFAPPERTTAAHLGASNKIASVIRILHQIYGEVALINSAHNECRWSGYSAEKHTEFGPEALEIRSPRLPWRAIGKAWNLLHARGSVRHLPNKPIACIWVYNAYALDGRIALLLKQRFPSAKLVLEIEDWPGSRPRSWTGNLKNRLDGHYFDKVRTIADLITIVNTGMADRPELTGRDVFNLPCILHPELVARAQTHRDAPRTGHRRVGYFGGMNKEKGFDVVLTAVSQVLQEQTSQPRHDYVFCGTGPLLKQAEALAHRHPDRLKVFSGVPFAKLYELMTSCAFIINPHSQLPQNGNSGIFPFKIIEGIAAGARVISTPFDDPGDTLSPGLLPFDGSPKALSSALVDLPENPAAQDFPKLRTRIVSDYSEPSLADRLKTRLLPI